MGVVIKNTEHIKPKQDCGGSSNITRSEYQQLVDMINSGHNGSIDMSKVAKEENATANKNEILRKIENTQPDLSSVAKETKATENKEAIIEVIGTEATEQEIYQMFEGAVADGYLYTQGEFVDGVLYTNGQVINGGLIYKTYNYD